MKVFIILLISLFSFSVFADKCMNKGGIFSAKMVLKQNICKDDLEKVVKLPDSNIPPQECGTFKQTKFYRTENGCVVIMNIVKKVEKNKISGSMTGTISCGDSVCSSTYDIILTRKGDYQPPASQPVEKPKQEKDTE